MEKKTKVQKIIMTCKSFCFEKKVEYNRNIYNRALRLSMFAMAGLTAESNELNFSEETLGYPWGRHKLNKL